MRIGALTKVVPGESHVAMTPDWAVQMASLSNGQTLISYFWPAQKMGAPSPMANIAGDHARIE